MNEKAKDSHFLQASITKCQPFSFGAKIFLTDDAACLQHLKSHPLPTKTKVTLVGITKHFDGSSST